LPNHRCCPAPRFCRGHLERIVEALPEGRRLDIGAEDSAGTDVAHDLVRQRARAGAPIQMTLQANLRRSAEDWLPLIDDGLAIRLVKGAYVEAAANALSYGTEPTCLPAPGARDPSTWWATRAWHARSGAA